MMINVEHAEKYKKKNKNIINGIYISAAKRNSGKTTISIALSRLLGNRGLSVRPFKKGPDFIDPMWLNIASRNRTYNLDFYFMSKDKIRDHFLKYSLNSDVSIVEGNHGLHDSIDVYGKSSNAEMAKLLGLPVILIIDVGELNRGVVPLILGYKEFDKNVDIKGIILNKVHSKRHEKNLIRAIKYYTDLKVAGSIPNNPEFSIKQRHLGLLSTMSGIEIEALVDKTSAEIANYIDLEGIIKISKFADKHYTDAQKKHILKLNADNAEQRSKRNGLIKIGLAFDNAFNFYYNENLEALENLGCEIIKFSPIADSCLPEVDALYIGGGFPEIFAQDLQANNSIRQEIKQKIEGGLPVYAECGGLMYLCKSISYENRFSEMVGIIEADVKLTKKPKGHGYTKLMPYSYGKGKEVMWFDKIKLIKGHEFHHSYLEMSPDIYKFIFKMIKGYGVDGFSDGIAYKNLLAGYTHMYSPSSPGWFKNWVAFIKRTKNKQKIK
ncbi:MAG: cobyrinate a,c-diamide synthase [Candidatus Acidulodesulfobacterium sp.]